MLYTNDVVALTGDVSGAPDRGRVDAVGVECAYIIWESCRRRSPERWNRRADEQGLLTVVCVP